MTITVTNVNETPSDLALSATTVAENVAANSTIGTLSTTDVDASNTFTYTLVSGTGDTDNAAFTITGTDFKINAVPNFEAKSSYAVRIKTTDQDGLNFEKAFTITVTNVNEAPSDLALSSTTVAENVAANSTIGTLSTTDVDASNTFTYTLVSGTGDTDNAAFNISGSSLRITASPDFETKSSYSVRVKTTDQDGLSFEKAFTITILDVVENVSPTDMTISSSAINENNALNASVGTLSSTDADAGDTHTYTLVSGTGATDNASFNILNNQLRAGIAFDFETKSSYSVRVRTTDTGGLSFEKVFTITVTNVNEAPTAVALSVSAVAENASSGTTVGALSTTDVDAGDTFTYTLVSGTGSTDNAGFAISGANLVTAAVFDFETKSSYAVRVRTTDAGGLSFDRELTITVTNVNEAPLDITLSATSIDENVAVNSMVGTLSTTGLDASNTFNLVTGTGDTDNALFSIDGANLRTAGVFDFETKSSYSVRVRTTDAGGLSFEKAITITVLNVNEAPTDLALSAVYIYENNAINATIGELSSKDQDAGDKHTYTLVSGDVAAFDVSGNQLLANAVYVHGTKSSYEIVINTTDAGGLSVNKSIRITILESPEVIGRANLAQNKHSSVVGEGITISKGYSANLVLSASNIVKYTWSPATGLSSTNISNPIASPTQTTTYTVRVTNTQGISTDVFVTVTVLEDYNITPNNVLSPDGDGVNDFWTIENLSSYPNNEVKIFDKAGRIIFNEKNYQNTWNGQLNGTTLHEGTYYYVINLGPGTRPKTGYITLFSNK
jgi:gliding motility-associated-like protein